MLEPSHVIEAVCAYHRLTPEDLRGPSKVAAISWPRHELIYCLRSLCVCSLSQIGLTVGGRDGTTVAASLNRVAKRRQEDDDYEAHMAQLEKFVLGFRKAAAPVPSLAVARRMLGAGAEPDAKDVQSCGLALLTVASVLASKELTDAEARRAALTIIGEVDHA